MRPWLLVFVLFPSLALAQLEQRRYDPARYRPGVGLEEILGTDTAEVPAALQWDMGAQLEYQANPLLLVDTAIGGEQRSGALLAHRLTLHLHGSVSFLGLVQLGIDWPIVLAQVRDADLQRRYDLDLISVAGLGDLRVSPKVRILNEKRFGLSLALMPRFRLPFQAPRNDYLGNALPVFEPEVLISKHIGPVELAGSFGFRVQREIPTIGVEIREEIFSNIAFEYTFKRMPLGLNMAAAFVTDARAPFRSAHGFGTEIRFGANYEVADHWMMSAGVGVGLLAMAGVPDARVWLGIQYGKREFDADIDGIVDDDDLCPAQAEDFDDFEDEDGCPEADNDQDGIDDFADGAPNLAEDVDGHEDLDGIPDPDNDGDGVLDIYDQCDGEAEDVDGFDDDDGCPDLDDDKDNLFGDADACPNEAEDVDGFEDDDGCPEPDNDKDGIPDGRDTCPNEGGPAEFGGCAQKMRAVLTETRIEILEKVYFETSEATILEKSHPVLIDVAAVMRQQPTLRIRIEGHTDNVGSDVFNQGLSEERAEAVRLFLSQNGVERGRIELKGFGASAPLASNREEAGRAANRRVEFVVLPAPQ